MQRYRRKPLEVKATQFMQPTTMSTDEGPVLFGAGSWLVLEASGDILVLSPEKFKQEYESVEITEKFDWRLSIP